MSTTINILDIMDAEPTPSLDLIRFTENETAIIPFTTDVESIELHYCAESEIGRYVPCSGDSCLLCKIGRGREPKLLLPVFLPTTKTIGVIPVGRSQRPYALLPQLHRVLKAEKPMVAFVRREGYAKYFLSTKELPEDADSGEEQIAQFEKDYEARKITLSSVYPHLDNHQLAQVTEIAALMTLKGITLNADDSRA